MNWYSVLGVGYILTIIVCLVGVAQFIFRKEVRHAYYKRYKMTCYVLAVDYLCLAIGNLAIGSLHHWVYRPMPIMGLIATIISSSQSLLFTIALIVLFSGRDSSLKRFVSYAIPIALFPLLYFIATRFQENYDPTSLKELCVHWGSNLPLTVRCLFCITYIVQLVFFTQAFFKARERHIAQARNVAGIDSQEIQLKWVSFAFIAALLEGIVAILIQVYPCAESETIFRITTLLFYTIFPLYYVKYGELYNRVKHLTEESPLSLGTTEKGNETAGMEQLLSKLEEKNNLLFEKVEAFIQTPKPYLNPDMKPEDLIKALGTNRTYLANAIRQNKQQTISEYILSLRLREAQEILKKEENQLIEEISLAAGFNSLRTFNRNFKNSFGITPEEYRKSQTT